MTDYAKLYARLCGAIDEVLDELGTIPEAQHAWVGHVLIVVGIVGLSLDADFSKKFFPFLFSSFRHFILYIGHIVIAAGKRSKEDAVHVEIGAGLDAYTKDKAYCQLSKFLIHPVLLISQ